jgi:acetyl-CoA C-acetyltransferase
MTLPSSLDPNTPVIVGVGQLLDLEGGSDPITLAAESVRRAEADAGVTGLASRADTIAVVPILSWRYEDPAALVAAQLGATPTERWTLAMGGNSPQKLVNRAAAMLAAGTSQVAVVCGAEAWRTRTRLRRAGQRPDWVSQDDTAAPTWSEGDLVLSHPAEIAHGILMPTQCYPLFENALRHQAGRSVADHTAEIARLWSGYSAVAATNPYAVDRVHHSAEAIATVTEENRIIGFPYTKHMVSNPDLDAAAAVLLCTAAVADAAGIPRDRWVFPWSGADGDDPLMSERPNFVSSAAMRIAGGATLELAGVQAAEVEHLDVYSCFPSAVEIACAELGIDSTRQLTVGGGLCFAGGAWNNPVSHAIASMVDVLRAHPGDRGLVTANGGILQKHSFGVYSTEPPAAGFRHAHPQFAIDSAGPKVPVSEDHAGPVVIEAWTVMHERDGSRARAHAALRTPEGARCWGVTDDAELMARMEVEDLVGVAATRSPDATLQLSE